MRKGKAGGWGRGGGVGQCAQHLKSFSSWSPNSAPCWIWSNIWVTCQYTALFKCIFPTVLWSLFQLWMFLKRVKWAEQSRPKSADPTHSRSHSGGDILVSYKLHKSKEHKKAESWAGDSWLRSRAWQSETRTRTWRDSALPAPDILASHQIGTQVLRTSLQIQKGGAGRWTCYGCTCEGLCPPLD